MFTELLQNYSFLVVMKSAAPLGAAIGMLGGFVIQRREVPITNVVPNGAFAGVLIAYIMTGNRAPSVIYVCALAMAIISSLLVLALMRSRRISQNIIKVFMSCVFFGLCMMLFTYANRDGSSGAGLKKFIFGEAATILKTEMDIILYISAAVLLILIVGFSRFKAVLFDAEFARTVGISPLFYDSVFGLLCVMLIASGIQIMGILLLGVLFVAPAVAARILTNKFGLCVLLSGFFGFISASAGGYISSTIENVMTGPAITLSAVALVFAAFMLKIVAGAFFRDRQHAGSVS